jgi:hypothetical protein
MGYRGSGRLGDDEVAGNANVPSGNILPDGENPPN